ncbi:MAG: LolA family protein [Longibaculum sp.]
MNKKYIAIIAGVVLLVGVFCFFKLRPSSLEKMMKEANGYKSYQLVCNMEMLENDELKSYQVTSSYASIDDKDYYKVELYDKSLNQAQVIVRNQDGVFVLTPSLNQIFQFKSDWPNNSPKPYIYQSLLSFIKDNKPEKVKDGYLVNGKMTYENDDRIKSQEIKFDKNLKPVYVTVFDDDGTEIIKLTTTSFKANQDMKKEAFLQDQIMKESQNQYSSASSSLPLYPVALMGSTLENEKVAKIDQTTNHILKFTGDKSFTIIESGSTASEKVDVEVVNGKMIDLIDGIAFENENQMTYVSSGVVCSLYSHDLTKEEMLAVLSSMQASNVK